MVNANTDVMYMEDALSISNKILRTKTHILSFKMRSTALNRHGMRGYKKTDEGHVTRTI